MGENKGSKLFVASVLDVKDDLEERFERCYETVKKVTNGLSDREAHDALVATVCKGSQQHEEITVGLLYSMLTEPHTAAKMYRDLSMVSRDGMVLAWSKINQLIIEKFIKLQEVTRTQAVWITKEMVKNSVSGVDNVCSSLIKQIAGGDLSPRNIWLAEAMLDIFTENREWLQKFPVLMCMAVFTYLRVIEDHNVQTLTVLRQREVEFCITILRNRFMECCRIGRDLLRLLQNVARIPEFEQLWKDILHRPQSINPQFGGVPQLMGQRTSPKYLACRLTPDMEKKIIFLTSKVKFGQQKRYQDWFQKQYLSTPESQSLRCDLIRYICCVVHPSNEVLCSDIIQRWAVIGWLLTTCTSNVAASSAKLALFYDWLFFIQARANIMDIEPAILVMHHSMRSHPAITATLLDFLCRIIPNFYPPLTSQVKLGVMTSLRFILEKRVLPSLSPLFDNAKLDKELRAMIRDTFSEFCSVTETPPVPSPKTEIPPPIPIPIPTLAVAEVKEVEVVSETPNAAPVRNRLDSVEGTFSDEEEEDRGKNQIQVKDMVFRPIKEEEEEVDLDQYLNQLDGNIKELCKSLQSQKDADLETQCETMENLCGRILESNDFDSDTAGPLASFLSGLYNPHMSGEILPEEISDETMEDSLGKPIYVIFRNLSQETEDDQCPLQLLTLVCIMYEKHPKIGYNLLYYLHSSSKPGESKLHVYEEVCKNTESGGLSASLVKDFKACQEDDVRLLGHLVTPIYTQFPDTSIESTELLNTIVSCIDSAQLQDLICDILQGNLVIFKKETVAPTLEKTLEWETFEQYCVWQLLDAHDFEVELLIPVLPKLNYRDHPEALASMLLLLKLERASIDLLKPLFCRNCKNGDRFTSAILSYWALQDEGHLADLTKTLMVRATSTAKRLRQRQQTNKQSQTNPTPEKMLGHLDALRTAVASKQTMFFSQEAVLQGLQHIQTACTDAQKTKFSDLFTLADELEDLSSRTTRSRLARRSPGASPRGRKSVQNNEPESSSESEEDDEVIITKPKPAKRRKKSTAVGSDSD